MNNKENKPLKKQLREKFISETPEALTELELIQLLLTYSEGSNFAELSQQLLDAFGGLNAIIDADPDFLMNSFNLSERTVVLMKIIPQLSRLRSMSISKIRCINSAEKARKYFENYFIGALNEQLVVASVNSSFRITDSRIISTGSGIQLNTSCREIVDFALRSNAQFLFVAHNHPQGSPLPSAADINTTEKLISILDTLGTPLIDHIITGKDSSISMREVYYKSLFSADSHGYKFSRK
ncbi:MAG: hypothetical protein J6L05_06945 [Ruminococcus sp.]|nr:hypothetical protein [Ruminococcus sp.]